MEGEREYRPVEIDKLRQLDHLCDTFSRLSRRFRTQGTFWFTTVNLEGNPYSVIVNSKTLFHLHVARNVLLDDCESLGLEEESQDIFQKYLRQDGPGSQARAQQEGRQ
jgi:hypothetical protein